MPKAAKPKEVKGGFQKGKEKTGGRQQAVPNKVPRLLKEAILLAAEMEGSNQHGSGKLLGFLRMVAREDLRGFVMLLGRVLPMQIETQQDMRVEVTYRSVDEVRRELESRGISMDLVAQIMHQPATVIDHEGIEMVDEMPEEPIPDVRHAEAE